MSEYGTESIIVLDEMAHIQLRPGMYVGSVENPTRLLEEVFDNSVDEALSGHCLQIEIKIDTQAGTFQVVDQGRGIPFDGTRPVSQDPPVLASTKLFSSGKFDKESGTSAYQIATGLHGVGLVACNALSDKMEMEIYRRGKRNRLERACSHFEGPLASRKIETAKGDRPFGTSVLVHPSPKYFSSLQIDLQHVEDRIRLAVSNCPGLKCFLTVDGACTEIVGTTEELILRPLSTSVSRWFRVESRNEKTQESAELWFGWETEDPSATRIIGCVNLIKVNAGSHVYRLSTQFKEVFSDWAGKRTFRVEDCLIGLRAYLNLKLRKTSFDSQVKTKLESKSDISIMDELPGMIRKALVEDPESLEEILSSLDDYRRSSDSKKILKSVGGKKRAGKFVKLRDCTGDSGELLIGEGESAVSGLLQVRDPRIHAILPLRGVVPNSLTKKDLLQNQEVREIVQALGCGVGAECDMAKLRYSKIIISTDADPAGKFISSLLLIMFSVLMPKVIQEGALYVCETPLYGYGEGSKFVPLWNHADMEAEKAKGTKIRRFKGLGEFNPSELKVFTLGETRRLVRVGWPSQATSMDKLQQLFDKNVEYRRQLLEGSWTC